MFQTILIDSDILVYKIAFAVEAPIYVCGGGIYKRRGYAEKIGKEKGLEVVKRMNIGSKAELKDKLKTILAQISDDLGTSDHRHFLTSSKVKGNFRKDVATIIPYKGNRKDVRKPFYYDTIRQMLYQDYKAMLVSGQEADDQIAIEQTKLIKKHKAYNMSIIASIDKDLLTIPGFHYNLNTRKITEITRRQALKNFYGQLLTGDRVDNIPGITRLLSIQDREKEADELAHSHYIKKYNEFALKYRPYQCYNYVKSIYNKYGFGEKEIGEIYNLLWLRRYENQDGWFDFKNHKRIRAWEKVK